MKEEISKMYSGIAVAEEKPAEKKARFGKANGTPVRVVGFSVLLILVILWFKSSGFSELGQWWNSAHLTQPHAQTPPTPSETKHELKYVVAAEEIIPLTDKWSKVIDRRDGTGILYHLECGVSETGIICAIHDEDNPDPNSEVGRYGDNVYLDTRNIERMRIRVVSNPKNRPVRFMYKMDAWK